jgi:IS30 family transposase
MRLRKTGSLSHLEREEISRSLIAGFSYCSIGKLLGRAQSTISREVARNGSRKTCRAMNTESDALQRGLRPKLCPIGSGSIFAVAGGRKVEMPMVTATNIRMAKSRTPGR